MANKNFNIGYDLKGRIIYGIFIRQSDGRIYDKPQQDNFVVTPSDPYVLFTEHSLAKGWYTSTILDGNIWIDDTYNVIYYEQIGGSPNTNVDINIGNNQFQTRGDAVRRGNESLVTSWH